MRMHKPGECPHPGHRDCDGEGIFGPSWNCEGGIYESDRKKLMDSFERNVHSQIRKAARDIEKIADYVIGPNNPDLSNLLYAASAYVREYAAEWKADHPGTREDR